MLRRSLKDLLKGPLNTQLNPHRTRSRRLSNDGEEERKPKKERLDDKDENQLEELLYKEDEDEEVEEDAKAKGTFI